jgi:hypothetical protein
MVVENVGMAITVTTVAIAITITSSRSLNPAEDTAELGRSRGTTGERQNRALILFRAAGSERKRPAYAHSVQIKEQLGKYNKYIVSLLVTHELL